MTTILFSPHSSICVNTLKKCLTRLTSIFEIKVAKSLPEKFSIIFDGWSSGDTHFLAVFTAFPSFKACGFQMILIAFSSLEEDDKHDANSHYSFFTFVLSIYKKSFKNVACVTGDNCATNLRLAKLIHGENTNCFFTGCASHRFQLSVKDILEPKKRTADKLNRLMKKLKNLVPAAKLRQHTPLQPIISCPTCWSSTFDMISCFKALLPFIKKIDDDEFIDLVPNNRETKDLETLYDLLLDFNSVTKRFQKEDNLIADVRTILDDVIARFTSTKDRLRVDANIVLYPFFESLVAKIQDNN